MPTRQQHESDLNDPKQRFVWAFQNLSYNGFPVAFPDKVLEEWSEHLSKCGFVHIDQVREAGTIDDLPGQQIHFQPPIRGQDHYMNMSGDWVDINQPIQQPIVPAAQLMTPAEKAKMIEEFREEGLID